MAKYHFVSFSFALLIAIPSIGSFRGRAADLSVCARLLSGNETDGLIAYLDQLVEHRVIEDDELVSFLTELEDGRMANIFEKHHATLSPARMIHYVGVGEHLKGGALDRIKLLGWARRIAEKKGLIDAARKDARGQTFDFHQKMEFHPLPVKSFYWIDYEEPDYEDTTGVLKKIEIEVILTNPIEVMSTLVTQKHWVELMGVNPSHFVDGPHKILADVNGKKVAMQPDNPVEQVSWWSALYFANVLSKRHGLKPAYDFNRVQFVEYQPPKERRTLTTEDAILEAAARGTLEALTEDTLPALNAPDGDVYLAEGYRLPTEAEYAYLAQAAGTVNELNYLVNEKNFLDHAWRAVNSQASTQPVARLKPLIVGNGKFYDVIGNVEQWCYDVGSLERRGGENPVLLDSPTKWGHATGGGSWKDPYMAGGRGSFDGPASTIGFRLVRTIETRMGR